MADEGAIDAVRDYYEARGESEWHRLDNPYEGLIEQEIHRRAFADLLPPGARVLDAGGGPGKWTGWLLQRGHRVVLGDLSPRMLEIARRELAAAGVAADEVVELDARDLSRFPTASFDAVLSMGPLYHLTDGEDRRAVVREARRVLRPGGMLLATVMTRYAWSLQALLESGSPRLEAVREMLADGVYRNPEPGRFTEAYLFRPEEIAPWFETAGFTTLRTVASQSFLQLVQEDVANLRERDPVAYEGLMEIAYEASGDPSILGISNHVLYAGRAPGEAR
ncbi:MAG: class I SAM-dependent methyltransferase [Candidatus Dormibacteria bacterium]